MGMNLDLNSLRVLGALMEKEMTTPDAYPLSVNSLMAAANQRSSRDPVMDLSEEEIRAALDTLAAHELVNQARDGSRVPRFEHRIRTVLNLRRDETAAVCLLLLRGAQTPGELRSRSDRMHAFDDLAAVQATLDRLASRETPLVMALPRQPGSREIRSIHLLGDTQAPVRVDQPDEIAREASVLAGLTASVRALEQRVRMLEERLVSLN
jgi:uncharacterized protein YceH (UPF0502 family)